MNEESIDDDVVKNLKEKYIRVLDCGDIEGASAVLAVLRYWMEYEEFKLFLEEVKDAGYTITRKY
jgi:hypothetical protein